MRIPSLLKGRPMASCVERIALRHCNYAVASTPTIKHAPWKAPSRDSLGPLETTRSLSTQSIDEDKHKILALPSQYLRAMDTTEFDASTFQRTNVRFNPEDGKPIRNKNSGNVRKISSCSFDAATGFYEIIWEDGRLSRYSNQWVEQELAMWRDDDSETASKKVFWTGLTEDQVRSCDISLSFHDAVLSEDGMTAALKSLYQYGIVLITNTPTEDGGAGVAALAASLGGGSAKDGNPTSLLSNYRNNQASSSLPIVLPNGTDGPMRTLYGNVWSTESSFQADGASVADSAYGQEGLPLHTDMTYHQDPPGLQIFTMVQPATKGGESVFGDGFAVAEHLRRVNPKALSTLSSTIRRYRCIDPSTGWHLEAHGPVITVRNGQIVRIRHNDLDRLPDLPPCNDGNPNPQTNEEFYQDLEEAHFAWDELLSMDKFRLVMALQPGDTMVVANQRCFHGRYSFETTSDAPRAVIGCYMSQDELTSRFRREGFVVA